MRPVKRVKMLDADEYRVLKRALASRRSPRGRRGARRPCCSPTRASPPARGLSTFPILPFGGSALPGLAILSSGQTDERRIEIAKLIATTQATSTAS